jgi:inorganic triphosphatase YgiF
VASEIEAKLLVPRQAALQAIARLPRLGTHRLRARGTVRLYSIYVDTPALILARHGVALRLRRQGRCWEATAKWAGRVSGDVHERPELTVILPRRPGLPFVLPDGPLRVHLAALVGARPLNPIMISDIRRRVIDVLPAGARGAAAPIAELALDRVRLRGPRGGQPEAAYCEVEIEQRHGKRGDVVILARRLRRDFGLLPSGQSKFARGLALLYGRVASVLQ